MHLKWVACWVVHVCHDFYELNKQTPYNYNFFQLQNIKANKPWAKRINKKLKEIVNCHIFLSIERWKCKKKIREKTEV